MSGEVPIVVVQAGHRGDGLPLDEELRNIRRTVTATPHGATLATHPVPAARLADLEDALYTHQPMIVHFAGNGRRGDGFLFRADDGGQVPVESAALCSLMQELAPAIALVLVNACWGTELAGHARDTAGCAIGMDGLVDDTTAREFSDAFYKALGHGRSVGQAFRLAHYRLATFGVVDSDAPTLYEHDHGHADTLYLIPAQLMGSPPRDTHKPGAGVPLALPRQRKYAALVTGVAADEQELRAHATRAGFEVETMVMFEDE